MATNGKAKNGSVKANKFINFFRGLKGELKRMTWPSKEKTKKSVVSVFMFILIWVLITSGMDVLFKRIFEWVFSFK